MRIRVTFIHPEKGYFDASIEDAPSVDEVASRLKEIGCSVLVAEEE